MITLLISAWAVIVLCLLAVIAYRGQLTRYEDDQLFLSDNNTIERQQQDEIQRKISRLNPMLRVLGGVCGLLTMGVVGAFAWDAYMHIR